MYQISPLDGLRCASSSRRRSVDVRRRGGGRLIRSHDDDVDVVDVVTQRILVQLDHHRSAHQGRCLRRRCGRCDAAAPSHHWHGRRHLPADARSHVELLASRSLRGVKFCGVEMCSVSCSPKAVPYGKYPVGKITFY